LYLRTLIRNTIQRHVSDKQTATVVFQGKRMREKAKDMIAKGLSKAQWRNPQDDTSMLYIYVVPTGEINDDYPDFIHKGVLKPQRANKIKGSY